MGLWDNWTTELWINYGIMGQQDTQWDSQDYGTNYGTTLITGYTVVPLPIGQTMGSWDNRTMGLQNYRINYGTTHITGSKAVPLPKKDIIMHY